jgi:transcriptional regulator with XRE-family HTH domain
MAAGDFKLNKHEFTDTQKKRLGEMIKAFRKKKYSSSEAFANANNIPRANMGRYEKGHNITFANLIYIIYLLELTPKEFFEEWSEW